MKWLLVVAFTALAVGTSAQSTDKSLTTETQPEKQLSERFCQKIGAYEHVLGNFSEGLLPVVKNRMLGYVNANGEEVVPCSLKYYIEPGGDGDDPVHGDFHEGLARVSTFDGPSGGEMYNGVSNVRFGYIDKTGRLVIPYSYTEAKDFSEGKAYVVTGGSRGFIDKSGKLLFTLGSSAYAEGFSDGLALVKDWESKKPYFVDEKGNTVLTFPRYATVHNFHDGLAYYDNDGWKGFIDKSGKHIIDCTAYEAVHDFSEGLAAVSKDGKTYGFIDTKGNIAIPISYEGQEGEGDIYNFRDFHDGLCGIFDKSENKWHFINKKEEVVLKVDNGIISDMNEGVALVDNYDMERNISHYSIVTKQGFSTGSYTDEAVEKERTATLVRQQEEDKQAFDELQAQRERESELYRQREEEKRRAAVPTRFTSYMDAYNYVYPSMKFYGRGSWFKGTLEIRANDKILTLYANGFPLGTLLNRGAQYKSVDVKDNMVRFFIQDSEREYPLVIHMPDKLESKPYIYFEPVATRDFRGDFDFRYRNEKGWEWFEPVVDDHSASMMFHPTREEPIPVRYVKQ